MIAFYPLFYMMTATLSLIWFTFLYSQLYSLLIQASQNNVIVALQPVIQVLLQMLEKIFGAGDKYVPTPTHVILVALMLVVYVQLERIRSVLTSMQLTRTH